MALSDTKQSVLMFIATALIVLSTYIAATPEAPRYLIIIFGALAAVAIVAKEQMGAKKAQIADVAKTVSGVTPQ